MKRPSLPASILLATAAVIVAAAAHDASVPMRQQFVTRSAIWSIEQYRHHISPRLANGKVQCRFKPTCSKYGLESVKKYGGIRGGWRTVKRIARCTPATPIGTVDPP